MSDQIQGQIDALKTVVKVMADMAKGKGTLRAKLEIVMIAEKQDWFKDKSPEYIEGYNETLRFFIDVEPGDDPI